MNIRKYLKSIVNRFLMKTYATPPTNPPVTTGDTTTSPSRGYMNSTAQQYAREVNVATSQGETNGGVLFSDLIRNVYSREIEFKALPIMRFFQFATVQTELGTQPGLTISMLTYDNLKLGGALEENKNMETQAMTGSTKQLTVTEWGNAISVTEKLLVASFDDIMARATTLLGRDYAMVVDMELRDAALSGTNIIYARDENGNPIDARADLTNKCILKVSTVKDALEILATNLAARIDNYWICFVHPHQSRNLRDDPAWINASNYGAPGQLFSGEIGRIDDVRFIETTILNNGADVKTYGYDATLAEGYDGNQTNIYQAVLFGDNYYGFAEALPVELRDNGVEDFGRKHSLGWYAIFGVGLLHDQWGIVIETA